MAAPTTHGAAPHHPHSVEVVRWGRFWGCFICLGLLLGKLFGFIGASIIGCLDWLCYDPSRIHSANSIPHLAALEGASTFWTQLGLTGGFVCGLLLALFVAFAHAMEIEVKE